MSELPARLVIGGLWEGAPIVTFVDGNEQHGVYLGRDEDGDSAFTAGHSIRCTYPGGPVWRLSLRLPGPLGLGAEGIRRRVRARMAGFGGVEKFDMPEWFWPALGHAALEHEGNPWLSRYLVMTDALAGAREWPVGPGAPVYGWQRHTSGSCVLSGPQGSDIGLYRCAGNTDPMDALEGIYEREVTP